MIGEVGENGFGDEFVADFVYVGHQVVSGAFGVYAEVLFLIGQSHFTRIVGEFLGELKEVGGHGSS